MLAGTIIGSPRDFKGVGQAAALLVAALWGDQKQLRADQRQAGETGEIPQPKPTLEAVGWAGPVASAQAMARLPARGSWKIGIERQCSGEHNLPLPWQTRNTAKMISARSARTTRRGNFTVRERALS